MFLSTAMVAQENTKEMKTIKSDFEKINNTLHHRIDVLEKSIDDLMWFQRLGDVAYIDKLYMTGPPLWKEKIKMHKAQEILLNFGHTYLFLKILMHQRNTHL